MEEKKVDPQNQVTPTNGEKPAGSPKPSNGRKPSGRKDGKSGKPGKLGKDGEKPRNPKCYDNDISWYAKNADMVDSVANLPTLFPNGSRSGSSIVKSYYTGALGTIVSANNQVYSMPGILSLEFSPFFGHSSSPNSPLNIGLQSIYTMIRHKNSGAKNYEASDLGQYLMLMDSIYSCIAEGMRAYGACFNYSVKDYYQPRALVEACGFDYDNLVANQANFRTRLNACITKANAFAVPNVWNIILRHVWLNSNIFRDNDEDNSQLYVFKQMNHYTWVDYENAIIGPATGYNKVNGKYANIDTYFNRLEMLINNVWLIEDAGTISGDVLKAYDGKLVQFGFMNEDHTVEPVYSKEVLQQITNTVLYGYYNDDLDNSWNIYQDTNQNDCLISEPNIFITSATDAQNYGTTVEMNSAIGEEVNVYLHKDFANPAGIMISTRNIIMGEISTKTVNNVVYIILTPTTFGSEIFFAARLYVNKVSNSVTSPCYSANNIYGLRGTLVTDYLYITSFTETIPEDLLSPSDVANHKLAWLMAQKFSYFPKLYTMWIRENGKDEEGYLVIGDNGKIGRYAKLTKQQLDNIHNVAILSLLGTEKYGNTTHFGK